jgi:hypothetical protein
LTVKVTLDLLTATALQQCVIQRLECGISEEILADIEKETVDFQLNFDDTLYEPKVMPTCSTLIINGATGIAVGMATICLLIT